MRTSRESYRDLVRQRLRLCLRAPELPMGHLHLVSDRHQLRSRRAAYAKMVDGGGGSEPPVRMTGGWIRDLSAQFDIEIRRLDAWEQNTLLRALVDEMDPPPGDSLGRIWSRTGTAASLARFVRELRSTGLESSEQRTSPFLAPLISEYEGILATNNLGDGPGLFASIARHLADGDSTLWDVVTVEGFWHFDPPLIELLRAVFRRSRDSKLLLAHDPERRDLFPEVDHLRETLGELYDDTLAYHPDRTRTSLARGIFHPSGWDPCGGPAVSVFRVADESHGFSELICALKKRIRGGTRPRHCCVVFPSEAAMRTGLRELFRAGVPVDGKPSLPVSETGSGRAVAVLLDLLDSPSAENFVNLASAPYMTRWNGLIRLTRYCPPRLEGEEISDHLEAIRSSLSERRRRRTEGISWESPEALGRWIDEVSHMLRDLEEIRNLLQTIPTRGAEEICAAVLRVLRRLGLPANLRASLESDGGWSVDLLRDLEAWNRLEDGLKVRLAGLLSQTRPDCPPKWVYRGLREMMTGMTVVEPATPDDLRLRPEPGRGVTVTTPEGISDETYGFLAMVDVSAGTYPAPIVPSWIRRIGEEVPFSVEEQREQNRRFYRAIRAARDDLLIMYPARREEDTPTASPYLQEMLMEAPEIFSDLASESDSIPTAGTWEDLRLGVLRLAPEIGGRKSEALELAAETLDSRRRGRRMGPSSRDLPHPAPRDLRRALEAEEERWGKTFGRWDGILGEAVAADISNRLHSAGRISVSALDTYAGCPFRYFASSILRLRDDFILEQMLSPLRVGQLFHRALEKYYRRLVPSFAAEDGESVSLRAHRERLESILWELIDGLRPGYRWIPDFWWESVYRHSLRRLSDLLVAEEVRRDSTPGSELQPYLLERRFSHSLGALTTSAGVESSHEIVVSGTIDRIDIRERPESEEPDGFLIFDYKLGWEPPGPADARKGSDFQMPLYLMATGREFPGGDLLGGGYVSVAGAHWEKGIYTPEATDILGLPRSRATADVRDLLRSAATRISMAWRSMNSGLFPVLPSRDKGCDNCPYATLCRRSRDRSEVKETEYLAPGGEPR